MKAIGETAYECAEEAEQRVWRYESGDKMECSAPQESRKNLREPEAASEFRLPWLWIEGWRHRLKRARDEVERCHGVWRFDNQTVVGGNSSLSIGAAFRDARAGVVRPKTRKKSVHWADQ